MSAQLEHHESDEFWISISDLMSGLMVVFLFIAVAYITNIAVTYEEFQSSLYDDLYDEFKDDLPRWNAELDRQTLSVRFNEPDVLFDLGESYLKPDFRAILDDFFPRYIGVLSRPEYVDEIEEVRIEGHTSSEWVNGTEGLPAYIANMELSQDRTRSVLAYVMALEGAEEHAAWLSARLTANGLSSSRLVRDSTGAEDAVRSRRVEFRVKTDAERRIFDVIALHGRQTGDGGSGGDGAHGDGAERATP